ncbi:MAG: hypothetical protein MJ246_00175 [Clostridia bacterium]|nr:hypothetical protein [Clostridia bacterium]
MGNRNSLFGSIVKGAGLVIGASAAVYGGYLLKKKLEEEGVSLKIKTIANELNESNKTVIDFKDIIKEDWDSMFVFDPYTSYETIYEALGFEWDEIYKTGISYRDDITLLVFVKDMKVVRYIEYPTAYGDFSKLDKEVYDDGAFELSKDKNKIVVKERS